jgi:hypothetical protein
MKENSIFNTVAHASVHGDFFSNYLREIATPIVHRDDEDLIHDFYNHEDPAVRENAAFEYIYRHEQNSLPIILKYFEAEPDHRIKVTLFEELHRINGAAFKTYLESSGVPDGLQHLAHAYYLYDGLTKSDLETKSDAEEIFDQVIPLRISLREYIEVEPGRWCYHVISPIQETRVAGQLYACSKVDTRLTRIVMTKQLENLHSDGSLHQEGVLFSGRTAMITKTMGVFKFSTLVKIPFYPSGRVGDESEGIVEDAVIQVMRAGAWQLSNTIRVRDIPVINNVLGTINAWGYTRPDKATFDPRGRIDMTAGLFHLGDLTDARVRDYINTFTIGSYRGVIMPGKEGFIGLNTNSSFTTLEGEIDTDRDGKPDQPGLHYDRCPGVHPPEYYHELENRTPGPKTKVPLNKS